MNFLASDTFRRLIAGLVGVALPVINAKLGLNIPSEQVIAAILLVAGYIGQSVANDMHARGVAAKVAAADPTDPAAGLAAVPVAK